MHRLVALAALMAGVLLVLPAGVAPADGLQFSPPVQLPHGDPKGSPYFSGGEPSLGFDPQGVHTYVVAPQGVPAALGGVFGGNPLGVAYWASDDGGRTWPRSDLTGTGNGGGDSDVEVLQDHTVLVADLEATAAAICISHDFAQSFDNCS